MAARFLTGKPVVQALHDRIQAKLATHPTRSELAVLVPPDPSAKAYATSIRKQFTKLTVPVRELTIDETLDAMAFQRIIQQLTDDPRVTGILALQPLPRAISRDLLASTLPPQKDVDGISYLNQGRLAAGAPGIVPSTPLGGIILLRYYGIELQGRHAVVVGRSPVVGRPLALLLLAADATVTICHTRTSDLATVTREADIVFAAAGSPGLVTPHMVKPGVIVVDFGVTVRDGALVGDVDPRVAEVADALTPVPGGTGPVTTAVLACNLLRLAGLWSETDWPF